MGNISSSVKPTKDWQCVWQLDQALTRSTSLSKHKNETGGQSRWQVPVGTRHTCLLELSSSPPLALRGKELLCFTGGWSHVQLQSCPSCLWQHSHHRQPDHSTTLKGGCLMARIIQQSCQISRTIIEYTSEVHKHGMVSSRVNSIAEQRRNIHVLHFRLTFNYLNNQG